MVRKNIFEVSEDEKLRILGLHESATKRQYLIAEEEGESFKLCGYIIVVNGGRYFAKDAGGSLIELPFESELGLLTTNKGREFDGYNDLTENGTLIGEEMNRICGSQNWPDDYNDGGYRGVPICYVLDKGRYAGYPVWNFMHTHVGQEYANKGSMDMVKSKTDATFGKSYTSKYIITLAMSLRAYGSPYKEPPPPAKVPEDLTLSVDDPFVFDKTDLTPEGQKRFDEFLANLKKYYNYIQKGDLVINTYASIDGDPNSGPVGGFKTRREYDLDLSSRRAKVIMDKIEDAVGLVLPMRGVRISAVGNGETTKFGPGWTKQKPTTPEETKPNRKLIITVPPLKKG